MPITRRGRGKGKQVDILVGEGTSRSPPDQPSQDGADAEFASRASSTFPAPEEPRRREEPAEAPVNATEQDLRNAVQILT